MGTFDHGSSLKFFFILVSRNAAPRSTPGLQAIHVHRVWAGRGRVLCFVLFFVFVFLRQVLIVWRMTPL